MASPVQKLSSDPMVPQLARVVRSRADGHDVQTLQLKLEQGTWDGFVPGQFNMLSVFGVGEVPISFSGDPTDNSVIVHTVRAVGAVSTALAHLKKDAVIGLRGPYGVGWPMGEMKGKDVIVVAGGLGLAPVRPVLYHVLVNRADHGQFTLLYGARNPSEILYTHELHSWKQRPDFHVDVTVDQGDAGWHGNVGVVTTLIPNAKFNPANTLAIVCGPEIMMRFAAKALLTAGVPDTSIYLSMERNMKCGIGLCGHCQMGPDFVCCDGPVFRYDHVSPLMAVKEL